MPDLDNLRYVVLDVEDLDENSKKFLEDIQEEWKTDPASLKGLDQKEYREITITADDYWLEKTNGVTNITVYAEDFGPVNEINNKPALMDEVEESAGQMYDPVTGELHGL